jgi:hypothetical protein
LTFINSFLLLQPIYTQILVLIAIESGPDPNPIYHLAFALDDDSPSISDGAITIPSCDNSDHPLRALFGSVPWSSSGRPSSTVPLRPNLIFLQTNKPVTAATMTRTPRATPRPIETPLFEPDLLPFGTEEVVGVESGVESGVEVGAEGVEAVTRVKYGAIVTASWKPNFSSQQVDFCDPQH